MKSPIQSHSIALTFPLSFLLSVILIPTFEFLERVTATYMGTALAPATLTVSMSAHRTLLIAHCTSDTSLATHSLTVSVSH
ncbi:hypothetical protein SISSUDRAFT_1049860 [Sistotremastrum suecicum HHB10207 ss-3]|uniref:Uncharacterized protein n=1 Tax=Sistotremastrum suecicum HHB10207 ss-3 TaxID=1314776 RepID=A0A166BJ58_9AGAM|nr:hypothetical protein SISSUDRAFT_1049860 [Sistotremastrum suecicum HHB10207 ss-3]